MHLSVEAHYTADPTSVGQLFADPAFVTAKVQASGAMSQQVDVVGDADEDFTVTTRRQMPTTQIPPQFRSFVGANLEVRQVEAWEAAEGDVRRGTVVVEITGAPVRLSGRMRLEPGPDGGAVHRVEGELKASVPLFAAAVEEATAGAVRAAFTAEEKTAREWLAR